MEKEHEAEASPTDSGRLARPATERGMTAQKKEAGTTPLPAALLHSLTLLAVSIFFITWAHPAAGFELGQDLRGLPGVQNLRQLQQNRERNAKREAERAEKQEYCTKAKAWLEHLDDVPPEVLARRSGAYANARYNVGISPAVLQIPFESWVLQDSRFVPEYGKPYDSLTPEEAQQYQKLGSGCQITPRTIGETPVVDQGFLERVFNPNSARHFAQGVQAIRAARKEGESATEELASLRADAEGAQAYNRIAGNAERLEAFMAAEERAKFKKTLEDAQERVVRPVLANRVHEAVSQAKGYEGLVALSKFERELQGSQGAQGNGNQRQFVRGRPTNRGQDAAYSSYGTADAATLKALHDKRSYIGSQLAKEERGRLDSLGNSLVGLERGGAWYRDFSTRYNAYLDLQDLAEVGRDFQQRRSALLSENRGELANRIKHSSTNAEVDQLVAKYFPFDFDQRSNAGTALMTLVTEQHDLFEKRRILGSSGNSAPSRGAEAAEPEERTEHSSGRKEAGGEKVAKGEPTEEVMYDLVKQKFEDAAQNVRNMSGACGHMGSNDPGAAFLCLGGKMAGSMGGDKPMKITHFEKLGCERASGKPGYVCDYMVGVSGGMTGAMGPSFAQIYGNGGAAQARFLKTKQGWIAFWE